MGLDGCTQSSHIVSQMASSCYDFALQLYPTAIRLPLGHSNISQVLLCLHTI